MFARLTRRLRPAVPVPARRLTVLYICRGLPGSGKTTWARQQEAVRVSRDDIRAMLYTTFPHGDRAAEDTVTTVHHAAVSALLRTDHSVVVDDTNLPEDVVTRLIQLAESYGVTAWFHDLRDVPLEECLSRNAARPETSRVPEAAIRRMYDDHIR